MAQITRSSGPPLKKKGATAREWPDSPAGRRSTARNSTRGSQGLLAGLNIMQGTPRLKKGAMGSTHMDETMPQGTESVLRNAVTEMETAEQLRKEIAVKRRSTQERMIVLEKEVNDLLHHNL